MTPAAVRRLCLALPGAAESVQWGDNRVFKVGGKMFAVIAMDGRRVRGLSFKCAADSFAILTALPGIRPAPYLARAAWVALDRLDALPRDQLAAYLARAHALVAAKLPRALRAALAPAPAAPARRRTASARKPARRASRVPSGS